MIPIPVHQDTDRRGESSIRWVHLSPSPRQYSSTPPTPSTVVAALETPWETSDPVELNIGKVDRSRWNQKRKELDIDDSSVDYPTIKEWEQKKSFRVYQKICLPPPLIGEDVWKGTDLLTPLPRTEWKECLHTLLGVSITYVCDDIFLVSRYKCLCPR